MSSDEQPKNRSGGRPRGVEQGSTVTMWVPTEVHDRLIWLAGRRSQSVSSFARDLVVFQLNAPPRRREGDE